MMTRKRVIPYFVILGLVVAGCFLISPAARAGQTASGSSEEVQQLLSQTRTEVATLERDAGELASWARAKQLRWESHAQQLNKMKYHVNEAGQLLAKLHEARGTASPWQQEAIDRIYPLLKDLADNTEKTINYLNDARNRIRFSPYVDYAEAGNALATELATLVRDYVEFGELEADLLRLEEKLASTPS